MLQIIELNRIHPHKNNPRKNLGDLTELTESIKERGILQNITIIPKDPEDYNKKITGKKKYTGDYIAIIGHRRRAAAELAGLTEIPCVISIMDEKTQIATMLLENIQRKDLTPYEQAQGLQMMLDLGDTVDTIAKRTGISSSTIRRRVQWAKLDKDKFEKAVERGGTIADYNALNKIKDEKKRNEVLEKVGTNNFPWALESAIKAETHEKNLATITDTLNKFATKVKIQDHKKHQYCAYISLDKNNYTPPRDTETEKYFYTVSGNSITLYKEAKPQEKPTKTPEQKEKEVRIKNLKALFKQAQELRLGFVKSFNPKSKHIDKIEEMAIQLLFMSYLNVDKDVLRAVFDMPPGKFRESWDKDGDGETYEDAAKRILIDNAASNQKMLFISTYLHMETIPATCVNSQGVYAQNANLKNLYYYLTDLGYEISDEETALINGTHELYSCES
ncbi:MAG: ParB/RepB/Spo0J family partition protein [Defluviitaleaceae bacterium]|nr:ParB/RepB/Spo0J family partition protein [Defluviitaleaceae bacterium]